MEPRGLSLSGVPTALVVATGTALAPVSPALVFEPASFNFSPVAGGQTSFAQLTIYSTGSVPLTISDISVTGSAFSEQSSTCPSSLAPSESCFGYINFEPSAAGTFTGSLNLTGNVSGTVPLMGTGTASTQFTLQTSPVGPGTIQQAPSGTSFPAGTSIMLTAVPNSNALFIGWSGACAGSANAVCTFSLTANITVTATFLPNPTVTASQPSQSGAPGSTFTFQISENGFTTKPTLTATCSIPKGGCSIMGTTPIVTTTASNSSVVPTNLPRGPLAPPLPLGLVLGAVLSITLLVSHPRARRILGAAGVVGLFVMLAGCGSSSPGVNPNTGTPAGSYNVSIQAVAGTFTAGTTVTITVQ
jgi:Divergent InlB B-repeat domain